jgi:hypothetical protein
MSQHPNAAAEYGPAADMDDPDPTAQGRESLQTAFDNLGGAQGLVEWARENQTAFYTAYLKVLAGPPSAAASYWDVSDTPLMSEEEWQARFEHLKSAAPQP